MLFDYPSKVLKIYEYDKNFAFKGQKENELFDQLANMYVSGRLTPEQFFQSVRMASVSKKELLNEVKEKYDNVTGIGAGFLGFIAAAALYKISEYTPINMQDYLDFWIFSLTAGWLTGIVRSAIPAINIDVNVARKKKGMVRELTDIVNDVQSDKML